MNEGRYAQLVESYNRHFYSGRVKGVDRRPLVALRGKNAILTIFDGERERDIVDANSGTFGPVSVVGYSNPTVTNAVARQMRELAHSAITISKSEVNPCRNGFTQSAIQHAVRL